MSERLFTEDNSLIMLTIGMFRHKNPLHAYGIFKLHRHGEDFQLYLAYGKLLAFPFYIGIVSF
ncbi:MAG TPA: hypothetical protein DIW34_06995 [Oribacterium sp.]|nr:hypothetical protein [Oribacterium sp.]